MRNGFALFAVLMTLVLIPLVWSGLVCAAHKRIGRNPPEDRAEKRVLAIMLAPVLTALLLLAWAMMSPAKSADAGIPLQTYLVPAVTSVERIASGIAWSRIAVVALGVLYLCGACFGATRLLAARKRHKRWASCGLPHSDWQDVRLVDMPISAFTEGRIVVLSRRFADAVSPEQLLLTIAHERCHIRRRDPDYYRLLAWLDVVFWFNPFLRAQIRNCRLAAELACDAAVLAAAPSMRKAYAATIVAALQHAAGDALACAPAAISPRNLGDHGMRIGEIMSPSPRRGKRGAALALAAVLAVPAGMVQLAYAQAASGAAPFMTLPLSGRISMLYGETPNPFNGNKLRFHEGIDIAAKMGADVVAPAAGRVVRAASNLPLYGNLLELDHGNGLTTLYTHLQSVEVAVGDQVEAGQLIARVGSTGLSTGPHLHLQVLRQGKNIDPAAVFDLKKS